MCLISLSGDLEMSWSWCIMGFVNIDGSYDVSPLSTLVVMNWVFPLRFHFYQIEYFYGFESTWCMSWHSTCGFSKWHWGNLCIGVDACFHPCFSSRNLGALFEVLCVGLSIINLKLFDAYRIINSRILVVTLEYLGDIRVGWCVSYGVILVRTLG